MGNTHGSPSRLFCAQSLPEPDGRDEPAATAVRSCRICARDTPEVTIPSGPVTARCSQSADREICVDCLRRHIAEEVNGKGNCTEIHCICSSSCTALLEHADVRKYAEASIFQAFDTRVFRAAIEKDPEFRWCSRPGCGSGQLHAPKSSAPIMRCHVCRQRTCFTHRCEWHTGRTCAQYTKDAEASEEVALIQTLDSTRFKRCPNAKCGHAIEKNGGCSHMTCRKQAGGCGTEFCWRCLSVYTRSARGFLEIQHKPTCTHFSG